MSYGNKFIYIDTDLESKYEEFHIKIQYIIENVFRESG